MQLGAVVQAQNLHTWEAKAEKITKCLKLAWATYLDQDQLEVLCEIRVRLWHDH